MNGQKVLLSLFKHAPSPLLRMLSGQPLEIDGFRLDPNLQLLAHAAARRQPPFDDLNKYRAITSKAFKLLNGPRRGNVLVSDMSFIGPACELSTRIYQPQGIDDSSPAILYFHQGGLVLMDLDTGDTFCTILASECRCRVISLDYRRCPEHAFPAPIEDAMALWDHVQQNAPSLAIDPHRVAVAGDSAGGLISSVLCQQLKSRGGTEPVAQLLIYPWVTSVGEVSGSLVSCADTFPLSTAVMEYFMGQVFPDGKGMDNPLANPLHARDLSGLPAAVVVTAGFDPLRDQGEAYGKKLQDAGVPVVRHCFGSLCHGFVAMGNVTTEAEKASVQIARDLAGYL